MLNSIAEKFDLSNISVEGHKEKKFREKARSEFSCTKRKKICRWYHVYLLAAKNLKALPFLFLDIFCFFSFVIYKIILLQLKIFSASITEKKIVFTKENQHVWSKTGSSTRILQFYGQRYKLFMLYWKRYVLLILSLNT